MTRSNKAIRDNAAVREFYSSEVRALMNFSKARAVHALIKEMDGLKRVAEMVIERLRDAGFVIKPADEPDELGRLKDAKRGARQIADERAREAVELRLENERLKAQLAECAAPKTA